MLQVALAGSFAASLKPQIQARLTVPCHIIAGSEAEIAPLLPDIDVLVSLAFTCDMGGRARRLKLLQVPGAVLDRIDRAALPGGTWLANAYGHEVGIAEYVMGAMLAMSRDFRRLDSRLRDGIWESAWSGATPPPWPELAGKTLCILGFGHIGRELARRAHAFDMDVRAMRRDLSTDTAPSLSFLGGPQTLPELLEHADYLAITLPLDDSTRGLLGRRELDRLKPSAYLINVARAEIVDEAALYHALAGGRLAGAALDVWYRYPGGAGAALPGHHPFQELSNVLMTPHVSGWTEGMLAARVKIIVDNIERAARGQPPANPLTPSS